MPEPKPYDRKMIRVVRHSVTDPPPLWAEYAYFALIVYAMLAPVWGISVPLLGAGGMGLLCAYCVWRTRKNAITVYAPLALPIGCAVTVLLIQIFAHDQSVMAGSNREFVNWIIALIVVQSLFLRPDFLHRFGISMLAIGLVIFSYLVSDYAGAGTERAGLEHTVGMANPNDLAAWFGFCCVFCAVVAVETRRHVVRAVSLLIAVGCLFVVGLTVSRTALVAVVGAIILAARRLPQRGFVTVVLIAIIGSGIFVSGIFDDAVGRYMERGIEETGRLLVWPLAIERLLASPFTGVGADDVETYVWLVGDRITPHNSFLYVGLASGILPLTLFLLYWLKAAKGAYYLSRGGFFNAPFQLPLMFYATIIALSNSGAFMFPWAIVTLCNALPGRTRWAGAVKYFADHMKEHMKGRLKPAVYAGAK